MLLFLLRKRDENDGGWNFQAIFTVGFMGYFSWIAIVDE